MNDEYPQDQKRTAEEVARRVLALHCCIAAAYGVSRGDLVEWLKSEGLWSDVSPQEQTFLTADNPSPKVVVQMQWRKEAQHVLLWALKKLPELAPADEEAKTGPLVAAIQPAFTPLGDYIATAELRPEAEIREEYENIYDLHVEVRRAIRNGSTAYKHINPAVIHQRHYAMNWLTGYCGEEWDEISVDT